MAFYAKLHPRIRREDRHNLVQDWVAVRQNIRRVIGEVNLLRDFDAIVVNDGKLELGFGVILGTAVLILVPIEIFGVVGALVVVVENAVAIVV